MKTDVLVAGSGCAGLYCALHLPKSKKITVITKSDPESSDSFLAQGGMCMLKDESDYEAYFNDTLKAGHFENDKKSVEIMIRSSQDVVNDLLGYNTEFEKDENGNLLFTREGAHSSKRILFHKDITGKEITSKLLCEAKKRDNIQILQYTTMLDIIEKDGKCIGAVIKTAENETVPVFCDYTVFATGGIGGLFRHSTNFRHLTGDAIAIAIKHGVELKDVDYIQIHPTTLFTKKKEDRSFLISESVRGEGAKLYDKTGRRFVNELLPRDVLTGKILEQMKKDGTSHVWEDLRTIEREELLRHFPNIIEHCKQQGYDATEECIPVVPAQHYFMGGIKVNYNSKTTMEHLYAVGETACNGVHGKNRLASNSLLESLVFAKRAAKDICETYEELHENECEISIEKYADSSLLEEEYKKIILEAIEEAKQKRENETKGEIENV